MVFGSMIRTSVTTSEWLLASGEIAACFQLGNLRIEAHPLPAVSGWRGRISLVGSRQLIPITGTLYSTENGAGTILYTPVTPLP